MVFVAANKLGAAKHRGVKATIIERRHTYISVQLVLTNVMQNVPSSNIYTISLSEVFILDYDLVISWCARLPSILASAEV